MRQNRKNWSRDEDETIINLVKKYGTKRWTLISQKMKERYPDDGRSGKQCRERWHNHLSPIINKDPWTEEEIKMVFDSHRKFGNKWTEIAQLLPGRTDNAVKNQFYSTLRKGLRRICKILGTRNSTTRIKKIKPTVLSSLISNFTQAPLNQDDHEHELYEMLFEFSNGDKYEQLKQKEVSDKNKQKMERLLQKILDSKDVGRKRKNKAGLKLSKNKTEEKAQIRMQKQQVEKQKSRSIKEKRSDQDKFDFNVNLDEIEQEIKALTKNKFSFDVEIQHNDPQQCLTHQEDFDERLEKPISLRRENSLAESFKDEQNLPSLKKRFSDTQRLSKRHQMQTDNSQNFFRCFLSKSPNFPSRIKMPTPRLNQNYHNPFFSHHDIEARDEDPQKFCNNVVEELKTKVMLRKQREERIR